MKKNTLLFLTMFAFGFYAFAQSTFPTDTGVYTVPDNSTPITVNINDVANAAAATAGIYDSYTITADWSIPSGDAYSSEARLSVVTSAGATVTMAPTSGGANSDAATTLTFTGQLAGLYDPSVDGFLDLTLTRTYSSPADWTNISVTINLVPACPDPSGMTTSSIASSVVDLSWLAGNMETVWNLEWKSGADFMPGTGTEDGAATAGPTATYSATGLTADTTYYIYYQADCGGDISQWVGPFEVTTLCESLVPDYTADMSVNVPDSCWEEANSGDEISGPSDFGSGLWVASNHNGTPSNRINLFTDTRSDWIISPEFDLSTAAPSELKVYVALTNASTSGTGESMGSDDSVKLLMTTDSGANWTALQTWAQGTEPTEVGEEIAYDLTAQTGTVQFAFLGSEGTVDDAEDVYFHVSGFIVREIPSCPEPSALTATTITVDSSDLGWTENGTATIYNVELVTAGTVPTGTATDTGVSNPYAKTGLTSGTGYEFYVQADCGGGDTSVWVGPFAFSTLCEPFGYFTENFDSVTSPALPNCWSKIENAATAFATVTTSSAAASSPSQSVRFFNSSDVAAELLLVSPELSGDITLNRILFSARDNDNNDIVVGTITDPTDAATFTEFETVTSASTFMEYSVSFDTYVGSDTYIAFKMAPSGNFDNTYIDDINWEAIPSCLEPSDLTATVLSATSAELGWTAGASETIWNVEVVDGGIAPTGTATDTGVTNSFTKTGLTVDTAYDFYVQADCGGGDTSDWIGPFSFFTGYCIPVGTSTDTYINNFSTTNGGVNISNLASGYTTGSYADNTTMSASQASNQSFDFSIEIVGGTVGCAVWVDWNNDFSFDVSEVSYSTTGYGDGPFTGTVTVPTGTADGDYRMRVMIDWNDFNPGDDAPCSYGSATTPRGETEDYTVTVDATLSTENFEVSASIQYLNPIQDELKLNSNKQIQTIRVFNALGQLLSVHEVNSNEALINSQSWKPGLYFVNVLTSNGNEKILKILKK